VERSICLAGKQLKIAIIPGLVINGFWISERVATGRTDPIRSNQLEKALAVCRMCRWQGPSWNYKRIRSEESGGLTRFPLKQEEEERCEGIY